MNTISFYESIRKIHIPPTTFLVPTDIDILKIFVTADKTKAKILNELKNIHNVYKISV